MTKDPSPPAATPQAQADREARLARESEALRANLRRRKDQLRTRWALLRADHDRLTQPPLDDP